MAANCCLEQYSWHKHGVASCYPAPGFATQINFRCYCRGRPSKDFIYFFFTIAAASRPYIPTNKNRRNLLSLWNYFVTSHKICCHPVQKSQYFFFSVGETRQHYIRYVILSPSTMQKCLGLMGQDERCNNRLNAVHSDCGWFGRYANLNSHVL